jgi:hypothetical protein
MQQCLQVSAALYSLMTQTSQLLRHMAAIRDLLLLGRGDLFRAFLEASASLLRLPPREATATSDLQRPFHTAAARCGLEGDPCFTCASISWSKEPPQLMVSANRAAIIPLLAPEQKGQLSWNGVRMDYSPPWPLPLLLTADALGVYRALFSYFFAVERVAAAMDETWHHLMTQRRASRRGAPSADVQQAWALLQRMVHFVRSVQIYLKRDVVQGAFLAFEEEVSAAATFVQVQTAHERMSSQLKHQALLTAPSVCEKLQATLQQCALFCRCASHLLSAVRPFCVIAQPK